GESGLVDGGPVGPIGPSVPPAVPTEEVEVEVKEEVEEEGSLLQEEECEASPTSCLPPSLRPPPASTSGGGLLGGVGGTGGEACVCGCTLALEPGSSATITATAALCYGTAVWLLQAPVGKHVVVEVEWATLRPGSQWLKLRDGGSQLAPLLLLLPQAPPRSSPFSNQGRPHPASSGPNPPPRASTGSVLLLEFHSDINSTAGHLYPAAGDSWCQPLLDCVRGWISGRVAGLAVFHCNRYHVYQRARLITESPSLTPSGSPNKVASCVTLSEVISLRSIVMSRPRLPVTLPLRHLGNSTSSYSPLLGSTSKDRHSLPNSPFLTRRDAAPTPMRRSCSQLARRLRRGSITRRKRRSASVDELEIRCISPITEIQREDEVGEVGKETCNSKEPEMEMKENKKILKPVPRKLGKRNGGTGSDSSCSTTPRVTNKDRRRLPPSLSRATSAATMRPSSSVSDMSMNGGELEFDYYDYDMDNASAVPGPPSPASTPTPTVDEPPRPPALQLNIPKKTLPTQPSSIMSEECNSISPPDLDVTPTAHEASTPKILNLDDIQFADDSDEDDDF
ncbi:hypothetical protein Pmani_030594, partial [Petrolisthes manimaculis]